LDALGAFLHRAYVNTYGDYGLTPETFESEDASRQLLSRYAKKMADPYTHVFVAAQTDVIVGIIDFSVTDGADTAEVNQFYVAESAHRQGIGSALWSAMESSLTSSGVRVTYLHVATTSTEARRFYSARAFRETWTEVWTLHTWTLANPAIEYIKMVRDRPR
jgi:ribosomal protein S18 acetylase RimI-like enzyme